MDSNVINERLPDVFKLKSINFPYFYKRGLLWSWKIFSYDQFLTGYFNALFMELSFNTYKVSKLKQNLCARVRACVCGIHIPFVMLLSDTIGKSMFLLCFITLLFKFFT